MINEGSHRDAMGSSDPSIGKDGEDALLCPFLDDVEAVFTLPSLPLPRPSKNLSATNDMQQDRLRGRAT